MRNRGFVTLLMLAASVGGGGRGGAAEGPILALDAGGHTAVVWKVLFTPDGKELLTVSDDKTIRFWDVATGEPLRTLRPPIGPGPEGMLYAAALSPDGRTLAVGGFTAPDRAITHPIYLLDVSRGEIVRRLLGHRNASVDLAFSPDGRRLISGSLDKTARIWDVDSGACEQTLTGHSGPVYGVAFSPDGAWAATASLDKTAAIWSVKSGKRTATLSGHAADLTCLDWSPAGDRLATGSKDHTVRFWTPAGRLLRTVKDLGNHPIASVRFSPNGDRLIFTQQHLDVGGMRTGLIDVALERVSTWFDGHTNTIFDARFSPDGRLVASTGGDDKETLLWRPDDGEVTQRLVGRGRTPWAAAWNAAGNAIAWGETNAGSELRATMPLERSFDLARLEFGPAVTAETAGQWRRAQFERGLLRLEPSGTTSVAVRRGAATVATLQPTTEYDRLYDTVRCFTLLADQRAAVGSEFGLWLYDAARGERLRKCVGHSGEIWAVAPSPDGRYLLSAANDRTLRVWDLDSRTAQIAGIGAILNKVGGKLEVVTVVPDGGAALSGRLHVGDRILGIGKDRDNLQDVEPLSLEECVALIRGEVGTSVWLKVQSAGTDANSLIAIERRAISGRIPRRVLGNQSVAFLEKLGLGKSLDTPEGFYNIVARLEASDVESHRRFAEQLRETYWAEIDMVEKGIQPLLSLFFAGDDWIAWTPEGYYAASPGGERLMGWHVNNGPDQLASFYPAAQFRKRFYRPDVIRLLLQAGSVERALELAGSGETLTDVSQNLPPLVEIVTPGGPTLTTDQSELQVTVQATQVGSHPVTSLQLLLNGRPLGGKGGIVQLDGQSRTPRHTFTVPLISGVTHRLQARADSAVSYNLSSPLEVTMQGQPSTPNAPADLLPSLYVLAIGVADYDDAELRLNFAAQDARNLAEAFATHSRGLYRQVETHLLTDKQATQRGILGGLGWLKRQMTQHDVGVVFYSGHGDRDEHANFYLLPSDVNREDLLVTGVPDAQVKQILQAIPGRVLVILDACHAGTLGGDRRKSTSGLTDDLVRDLATDDFGIVTMASSMGREVSLEHAAEQSGLFTLGLTEGLSGKADLNRDGVVYFSELDAYVSERVKELSRGRQHPVTSKPGTVRSFPLTRPGAAP